MPVADVAAAPLQEAIAQRRLHLVLGDVDDEGKAGLLAQQMELVPVQDRVTIIDACRDDPITRAPNLMTQTLLEAFNFKASSELDRRATFLSARSGQRAWESMTLNRGYFSYYLVKGLEGDEAPAHGVTANWLDDYVSRARAAIDRELKLPSGYALEWSGQYEFLLRASARLRLIIPITLLAIFLLLYLTFRSASEALIVMLSVVYASGSMPSLRSDARHSRAFPFQRCRPCSSGSVRVRSI